MPEYNLNIITTEEEWDQIAGEWNPLLEASEYNCIFLTFEWLKTWWKNFGYGKLSIISVEKDEKLIAIAPLFICRTGPSRVLKFIGTGASDYSSFILDNSCDADMVLKEIFELILTNLKWSAADFEQIPCSSFLYEYLEKNICSFSGNHKINVRFYETGKCYFVPKSDFTGVFLQEKHKSNISGINKKERKLRREGEILFTQLGEINTALTNSLFNMHIKKWRRFGKISDFAFYEYRKFHTEIMRLFFEKGWLALYSINVSGNDIAYFYAFEYNGKINYYITTYNIDFAKYSPGNLIFKYVLDSLKNTDIEEVDFLRGEEDYKLHWTEKFRTNHRLVLFKKGIRGSIYNCRTYILNRLYNTIRFKRITRYVYKCLRQIKLFIHRKHRF